MDREAVYTTNEVAALAGVTLRQLQWWDERKLVAPRHEGHRRIYHEAELAEIRLIAELKRKGCSLQKIRAILRRPSVRTQLGMFGGQEAYLVTDGVRTSVESAGGRLIDWIKKSRKPVIVVELGHVAPALRTSIPPDEKQARHFVNLNVKGKLPNPNSVPCFDCGHIGKGKRHEYDHDAANHENIQTVCTSCHAKRHAF